MNRARAQPLVFGMHEQAATDLVLRHRRLQRRIQGTVVIGQPDIDVGPPFPDPIGPVRALSLAVFAGPGVLGNALFIRKAEHVDIKPFCRNHPQAIREMLDGMCRGAVRRA